MDDASGSVAKSIADFPAPSARLICQRGDGVGCRLLTLLWTLRLARTIDAGVLMFWPRLELFSYEGSLAGDLFDLYRITLPQARLQIIDGDHRRHFRSDPITLHRRKPRDPHGLAVPIQADPWREKLPLIIGGWEGPFLAPGETPEAALAEMPAIFGELPFRIDLMREIERIAGGGRFSDAVAVHIRRGEIVRNLREAVTTFRQGDPIQEDLLDRRAGTFIRRCMSLDAYADALRGFVDQGREILVFSDEPGVHQDLSDALGPSAVLLPASSLIEKKLTPIQLAFVEAVLMSKCHCIVRARSAYSEFANIIGGNGRVLLTKGRRSAEAFARFMLGSISHELGSHPERTHVERRLNDIIGLGG